MGAARAEKGQPAVNLDDELEFAKEYVDVERRVIQDDGSVCLPSGDSGISWMAMEQPLGLRPGLGAEIEQQLAPGSVADPCSCELHRPMELRKSGRSSPQRLVDRSPPMAPHRSNAVSAGDV